MRIALALALLLVIPAGPAVAALADCCAIETENCCDDCAVSFCAGPSAGIVPPTKVFSILALAPSPIAAVPAVHTEPPVPAAFALPGASSRHTAPRRL